MSAVILRGDARHLPLPDESVDLIVTSPPYFGLRSYTDGGKHYGGQIGAEPTPAEYVDALLDCTRHSQVSAGLPGGDARNITARLPGAVADRRADAAPTSAPVRPPSRAPERTQPRAAAGLSPSGEPLPEPPREPCGTCGHWGPRVIRCTRPTCGHADVVHERRPGRPRGRCTVNHGPKGTPCGCASLQLDATETP